MADEQFITNLLRVVNNPQNCTVSVQSALAALEQHRDDERVAKFFADKAERERLEQLRQRALKLKKRLIK
jgi:hypothetical protein